MTNEITLRLLEQDDINDEYCSWYVNHDSHLNYFTGSGREFTREVLVNDFLEGKRLQKWFYYLVLIDQQAIGNIKIGPIDLKNKTSDLVCLIGNRNFLGKGLATKAIQKANQIAFDDYDIRRLQGGMFSSNIASIKAYTKAGWFIEATLKGYYWIENHAEDRVCVACLNPKYFPIE